jgi:hypothetical protein
MELIYAKAHLIRHKCRRKKNNFVQTLNYYYLFLTTKKIMDQEIVSKVWQIHGALSVATPGLLILSEGKVSFVTEQGEQFNVPVAEVKEVKWPFLQFGLGFNTVVNGTKYKFTFMKPNTAPDLNDSTLGQIARFTRIGRGVESIATLAHMGADKKTAKQWKAVLGG